MCEEITHLHLDIELLNPTLLSANIQPVLYTSTKSMFLWFREQDVVQDSPKYFAQVQVNDIGRSCLIPASTVIQPRKAPPFVGHGVPSVTFQQTPPYFSFSGGSPPWSYLALKGDWLASSWLWYWWSDGCTKSGCPTVTSSSGIDSSTTELFLNLVQVKKRL